MNKHLFFLGLTLILFLPGKDNRFFIKKQIYFLIYLDCLILIHENGETIITEKFVFNSIIMQICLINKNLHK